MILKIRFTSEENENFIREIEIEEEQTFYDLHNMLITSLRFDSSQIYSFMIPDKSSNKDIQITLFETDEDSSNLHVMDVSVINEFLKQKGNKFSYIFDFLNYRGLQAEVIDKVDYAKIRVYPCITSTNGDPPKQIV